MDAVRATVGFSALNALAVEHMRVWIFEVARNLATCEGVENLWKKRQVGVLFWRFGFLVEAKTLYLEVIAGHTETLGPTHTKTLMSKANLALLYQQEGDVAQSREIFVQVVSGFEDQLGPDHPMTQQAKGDLQRCG